MEDAAIHLYPGHGEFLRYGWPEAEEDIVPETRILEIAFELIDAFVPAILEPLAAAMELTGVDEWGSPVRPEARSAHARRLLLAPLPPWVGLDERLSRHDRREVPAITRQVLWNWMEEGLREPPPEGAHRVSWSKLTFPATRARLLGPAPLLAKSSLELDSEVGTVTVPVERDERGAWLSGPLPSLVDQPPIEFSISRPFGALSLRLSIHWSPWTQEESPGKAAIDAALAHLLTRGWERESEE